IVERDVRQPATRDAIGDESVVVQRLLDAEKILIGTLRGGVDEEASFARSDLQNDGLVVAEKLDEIERSQACFARVDQHSAAECTGLPRAAKLALQLSMRVTSRRNRRT